MQDLRYLGISNCSLTGTLPASLGVWPAMTGLYLDHNMLTGAQAHHAWAHTGAVKSHLLPGMSGRAARDTA